MFPILCILFCTLHYVIVGSQVMIPRKCPGVGGEIIFQGVSPEDKELIVNMHNHYRIKIMMGQVPNQPPGMHLSRMRWDDQLAIAAEHSASTCEMKGVALSDPRFPQVGQNGRKVTSRYRKHINWVETMQHWFNQFQHYKYGGAGNEGTLNYQQIVWAKTTSVGCAYIEFVNNINPEKPITRMYICNYGPGGNVVGEIPYLIRPGSQGPMIPPNFLENTNMNAEQFVNQQFPMPVFHP